MHIKNMFLKKIEHLYSVDGEGCIWFSWRDPYFFQIVLDTCMWSLTLISQSTCIWCMMHFIDIVIDYNVVMVEKSWFTECLAGVLQMETKV